MKINNENENIYYISYFIQILSISNFMDTCNEKIQRTYQLVKRQEK